MRRHRLLASALFMCLALAGVALGNTLTLSGGRAHARSSAAFVARYVPRATGYRLSRCQPVHGGQVRCSYQIFIRALSGGTITCSSTVQVHATTSKARRGRRVIRKLTLVSAFPAHPRCVRKPPPRARATAGTGR
jgi:hypothetical protein